MIRYLSGGMLGDFWKQLSIIYEKFLETNERAIVYMTDKKGDVFRFGLENTYNDIKPIISSLYYIEEFLIHQEEEYDIDLTAWRDSPTAFYIDRVMECYNVKWGAHPWLPYIIPTKDEWTNRIVINTTLYRFPDSIDWDQVSRWYGNDAELWFVGNGEKDYEDFKSRTGLSIPFYKPTSFLDMCTVIHSCYLYMGSMSTPMCIAYSLHKRCVVGCHHLETLFMRLNKYNKYIRYDLPTIPELQLADKGQVSMVY